MIKELLREFIGAEAEVVGSSSRAILDKYEFEAYLVKTTKNDFFVVVVSPDWLRYQEIAPIVEEELKVKVQGWLAPNGVGKIVKTTLASDEDAASVTLYRPTDYVWVLAAV